MVPVTGATYDGHEIQLYTDEDCENSTVSARYRYARRKGGFPQHDAHSNSVQKSTSS